MVRGARALSGNIAWKSGHAGAKSHPDGESVVIAPVGEMVNLIISYFVIRLSKNELKDAQFSFFQLSRVQ